MSPRLEQIQTQTQVLAPQLRQSLKVLQASALELRTVIQEEMQMNPTLEELPIETLSLDENKPSESPMNDEYSGNYGSPSTHLDASAATKRHNFLMESLTSDVSLQDHLMEQVGCLRLNEKLRNVVNFIIGSLNEKGFITLPVEDICQQTHSSMAVAQEALHLVQQLDPVGIGCPDIASSLLLQLKHKHKENSLAAKILSQCYPLLLRNKIVEIARRLSVSVEEVQHAIYDDIAKLDPAPGRRFQSNPASGIIPDVRVYKNHLKEWLVELNNQYIPQLRIGSLYKNLLTQNIKNEDRNYLKMKMRSGRFLIQAILQRQKTVEQIARALLYRQYNFFENGPAYLKPLTLQTLAEDLGVHETTVSRATSNKYLETPYGIFGFKYFFTKGLLSSDGECISNSIIKRQIQKIIQEEDKCKPLSDQKIAALLAQNKVQIARRTVTKYREMLGIPSTSLRRKYT